MALANLGLLRDHWCRGYFPLSHLINEVINYVFGICRVSHHLLNQALSNQRILLSYFLDYLLSGFKYLQSGIYWRTWIIIMASGLGLNCCCCYCCIIGF